ncbi:MAG: DUF1080 domain-containing protein [Planctomycetaceae bacterium]
MLRLVCQACMAVTGSAVLAVVIAGCADKDASKTTTTNGAKVATPGEEPTDEAGTEERDFYPLVLAEDFEVYPGGKAPAAPGWTSAGDVITCSGDPKGYIYSKEVYDNFTLRFDYQFSPTDNAADEKKLNTGVLVYINGEHKLWPVSLEVQGKYAEMGMIKANGGAPDPQVTDYAGVRQQVRRNPGEWNSVEVVSNGGALTVKLNGTLVCESKPGALKQGGIGFQAEGVEVRFRKIRVHAHDPDAT